MWPVLKVLLKIAVVGGITAWKMSKEAEDEQPKDERTLPNVRGRAKKPGNASMQKKRRRVTRTNPTSSNKNDSGPGGK
jgi:hypothetical protein